ncbi:MAG: hypothetical protein WBQ23_15600, partial [Bacteroidota bacterium]
MKTRQTALRRSISILILSLGLMIGVTAPSAQAQLNGNYTIGSGGNYATFTAAVSALSSSGVNGPVTFSVLPGTYTEQVSISPIAGANAVNRITFDGGAGNAATRVLQYNCGSGDYVWRFYGADYITVKNLTIKSTNTTYGYGVLFTNQADYDEVLNCSVEVSATSTNSYCIGILASSPTSYSSTGDWANNALIQDNTITGGYYGVRFNGYSSSSMSYAHDNDFVRNNVLEAYYYGLYVYYQTRPEVLGNTVDMRAGNVSSYGIYLYYGKDGPKLIGNYSKAGRYPFYFYRPNYYLASTSNRGLMANNIGVQSGNSTGYGLYCSYARYSDIVYNSVHMWTNSTAYGIYQYGESSSYGCKVTNNWVSYKGSGTFYAIYNYYDNSLAQFDYNGYYAYNPNANKQFRWDGTYYTSLASLQAANNVHDNSVWGNPYWVSDDDLHCRSHVGYQAGIASAIVSDDFDGDARGISPSIGADEYPSPPPENDLAIAEMMLGVADGTWVRQEGSAEHPVKVVLENTGLSNDPSSVTVTYKLGSMPADVNDGVQETFTPGWVDHKSVVEFTQRISGLTAGTTPTVYAKIFWVTDEDDSNDGGMASGQVFSAKVHGFQGFEYMEPGVYPFTRDPGYLDQPWTRIDNNGGASLDVTLGAFNGSNQALAIAAHTEAADEWIVTPGADLDAGSSYRLDFEFKNWGGSPVTIEAAFGETPDPTQMTVFATFANIAPGGFFSAKQLAGGLDPYFNTPLFNGTFYVAFHFTTSGTDSYFSFDNVKLDDNPSPPPKIAFGLPGAPLSSFIDNPAYKITVMANYKQPAVINRTYEVQSNTNIYGAMGDFLWDVETSTPWITLTKETPDPTLQNYNLNPPRPRQMQNFTLTVNPSGLAPGTHVGEITFYGILFNNDFPPPGNGLQATNEPLNIQVDLIITNSGSKTGVPFIQQTISTPLTVPGSPYNFVDPNTGDPIATVEVTSGQIDMMTIRAYPNALPQNLARKLFVKRYWQITHTGTGWTANVTFPYADAEAAMITDKMQLRGVRQAVALGPWEDPILGTTSVSDPLTNSVKVNDFNPSNIGGNIALAHPYTYGKDGAASLPMEFSLEQNYPNPFNPTTNIVFNVSEERQVRIAVYNNLGA